MVLLDLFSGTGGFALGFKKAGFVFDKHYFSEINPHAIANYTYNFPDAIYAGPIQNLEAKKIQAPDLITFGFPCQDLSSAGKQKGLSGKRSGLFFEALRLIRELKPRVFIFENVKGLLSSQEGKDFQTVLQEIANLGRYDCQWQLLNTSWFLPQNRERIYFVGCLAEYGSPTLFPFTQSDFRNQKSHEKKAQTQIAPTLDTRVGSGSHWSPYVVVSGKRKKKECSKNTKIAGKKYDQFDSSGKGNRSQNDRIYHREFSSPTLTASGSDSCKIYDCKGIRRLTPIECERLQGFPDGWTAFGNYKGVVKEISDTQRYQLLGNAVSVPVVKAIAKRFSTPTIKLKNTVSRALNGIRTKSKKIYTLLSTTLGTVYSPTQEKILYGIDSQLPKVPEINLSYKRERYQKEIAVNSAEIAADIFRSLYPEGSIQLQERFYVLLLSTSLNVLGYYHLSSGGITSTVADLRLILAAALKSASTAIMVCHNHPSGNTSPSPDDLKLTKRLDEACTLMNINLLDHLIITDTSYYSFAEKRVLNGLNGYNRYIQNAKKEFIDFLVTELSLGKEISRTKQENKASSFGITDKTQVKEYSELALAMVARSIARENSDTTGEKRFTALLDLYQRQANMSFRSSESILLGQYSTPLPITFLAGFFCGIQTSGEYFEPSAGNGLLTIGGNCEHFIVNELDPLRASNLRTLPYKEVLQQDASKPFTAFHHKFDAVLTNPPFGSLENAVAYQNILVKNLDHLMALHALDTMKDNGKAAFIIGGHTEWDSKGRIQSGKNLLLFNYLYKHYQITDVINIDGALYSKQGTSFDVRLVLVAGRKNDPSGNAPLKNDSDKKVKSFEELFQRVLRAMDNQPSKTQTTVDKKTKVLTLKAKAVALELKLLNVNSPNELGSPYLPASSSCTILNTIVPDAMSFETQGSLASIKKAVGGDMDAFVADRLGYASKLALCHALSAEQTDAVAMAIYNIEAKGQGMIIGDQTGIGKGRIAAAIITYAINRGLRPIFITEKPNLFSDLYRDLTAIGSGDLVPFILNSRESKTDIKSEQGELLHQALPAKELDDLINSGVLPSNYDFVLSTYSQFNSPDKRTSKPAYLLKHAENNILILDESHNASGSSNTGEFMQKVVQKATGVVFLSATFAKRPDNMPVYALKTAISQANMSKDSLVSAIARGGVALQEVLSSQLVAEGQMLRRERSFEGIEVNYISLDDDENRDKQIADGITTIIRRIIGFQKSFVTPMIDDMDTQAASVGKTVYMRGGTQAAGVDSMPYFSKVFQIIHQMLFSIKAKAVAQRAIARLKEGKKPVIAFASTMGSFIETLENEHGLPIAHGDVIRADFSEVLKRGLNGVMRYTMIGEDGKKEFEKFDPSDLSVQGMDEYLSIFSLFKDFSSGITISPIDIVIDLIEKAGYTVAEVTGRKFELKIDTTTGKGTVGNRTKLNTNDAFRLFNNNEVDVLMINQSGSTGASAHAIVTSKVPKQQVKQRVMIILQAELDINTEVQKRGRINRTGQLLLPIYDYVVSAIPAEKRLMMMLQKKLKSLDANTTSNQKQSAKILDVPDFLNKYGDKVVKEYLIENREVNLLLGDPLNIIKEGKQELDTQIEDAAHRVSGRVAVLSVDMQHKFYQEISQRYNDFTEYLKQVGTYDLEVETMDLQAKQLSSRIVKAGKGGQSSFGQDTYFEKLEVNVLKKPYTADELEKLVKERLDGKTPEEYTQKLRADLANFIDYRKSQDKERESNYYDEQRSSLQNDKKLLALKETEGSNAYLDALLKKGKELAETKQQRLSAIEKGYQHRLEAMERIINFFYVGKQLHYPLDNLSLETMETAYTPAICLGVLVHSRSDNHFLPGQVKIALAIAGALKYLTLPVSYKEQIEEIIKASSGVVQVPFEEMKASWTKSVAKRSSTREQRFMVTGNLLQAYADFTSGRLVSYTTATGEVKKGILLPETFEENLAENVAVPVVRASSIIASMGIGSQLNLTGDIALFRLPDGFKMIVHASKSRGGDYY